MAASPGRRWHRHPRRAHGVVAAALLLAGCSKKDEAPKPTSPSVRFATEQAFWSTPLPSDHRVSNGMIDLSGFPNPDGTDIVSLVLRLLEDEPGWGTTGGIFLPTETPIDPASLPDLHGSIAPNASVYLVDVDPQSPETGRRIPVRVTTRTGLVHGPDHGIAVVPLQGIPLRPNTRYAAVVTTKVSTTDGDALVPSAAMRSLDKGRPDDVFGPAASVYQDAWDGLDEPAAGLAVFTTGDPVGPMQALADDLRTRPIQLVQAPTLIETHDDFCVYEGRLEVTSYQTGVPPYTAEGGGIDWDNGTPLPDHPEEARFWITTPRSIPDGDWPVAVMVRTGGGGDRPMIDRGQRDATGEAVELGEGPARYFARAGWVGFQYDGPLGGLRNPTGSDEQFLVFNVTNMEALRDNLRQSAAELAALPAFLDALAFQATDCAGHQPAAMQTDDMALMGHSMGATIAPLVLPSAPEYSHVILSGAGGSWIENIIHKQSPLEVRPLAEAMLGYSPGQLTADDPFLSLLQWAGESADPPVHGPYSRSNDRNFLMFQGIVDTYILPPIANTTSLSFALDQGGTALDAFDERLTDYEPLGELQDLVGTGTADFPIQGNQGVTAVVVQHVEDGIEDGHEVMFQVDVAKAQYECFLRTARTQTPIVTDLCPQ